MKNNEAADLTDLISRYGDDQKCRNYLEHLRWKDGIRCPKCSGDKVSSILKRDQYNCDTESCSYQFSVTAGTIFHDTHLPLTKWFLATYLLCQSRKEIVVGIRQRGGDLRFFHAEDAKSGTLAKYIKENVSSDVDVIMTDEFAAYPFALDQAGMPKDKHKKILHRDRVYVDGDIYTNSVESAFSLLKRGIMGTWHRISAKHLQAYLDEMTWRFDNRKNPFLFRDTML